jgi:integrase
LKENLDQLLPKANKVRNKKHFPALPYVRVGEFMAELRKREGVGARALEFAILTAARSNEVRKAEWSEFDLTARLWTVPGERMKSGKSHRVPLSDAAIAVLKSQPRLSDFVFSNSKGGPVSDGTLLAAVKRMHDDDTAVGGAGWTDPTDGRRIVPHGFRSAFKDWARNVATKYRDEVSELALAHVNDDKTRAAYARDELMPQRTPMMADWAKYCAQPIKPGKVSKLERRA